MKNLHRKGKTNNPNGRPKGVPNKVTADLREWIKQIIENNRKQFETDLQSVEPQQRLAIMEKLLSYILPKLATIESRNETTIQATTFKGFDFLPYTPELDDKDALKPQ